MAKAFTAETTLEDITENPTAYGLPPFEVFCKNKEKWMGRKDAEIAAIDRGDPMLGCLQKYFFETASGRRYGPFPLELIETMAIEEGMILHHDFIKDPQLKPDSRGGFYTEVTFRPNPNAILRVR